jgi:putative membrane protein
MSERAFFEPEAKRQAKAAIEAIEAQTSAEVVVTLRLVSGSYRAADYLCGFLLAVASLVALLYVPAIVALHFIVLDVVLAFAAGTLACATIGPLRRLASSAKERRANVHAAACAAFVDQRVMRTTRRTGVLVYVAMFERTVEVVGDVGIDPKAIEGWGATVARLRATIADGPELPAFLEALRALGPVLAVTLPAKAGDANELPDDVDADEAKR